MNTNNTILVVDDDPDLLFSTVQILKSAGYEVIEASMGKEGLDKTRERQPDLVLLDILLPDIDGREVCKQIKANSSLASIYVILISGIEISSESQADGLEVGADEYIARPVSERELLARIQTMLRLKQTEEVLRKAHDELEIRVEERTLELKRANEQLQQEIEERKQVEKSLRENVATIKALVNAPIDFVALIDTKGIILDINEIMAQNFGRHKDELIGMYGWDLLSPDIAERRKAYANQVIQSGEPCRFEDECQGIWFDNIFYPVFDAYNKVIKVATLARDITERKNAEQKLRASHEQLRNLSVHLQAIREEERTTIAREIHDELGQALTALKMDLSWLRKRFADDQAALLEKANVMEALIDSTLKVVKRLATELRPGLLDDLGISAAIEWQAEEFQHHTGLPCEILIDPEDITAKEDISTAVFRVFQEILTNVARHANATHIHVMLRKTRENLLLEVRDNGKGITEKQIAAPTSLGLIGIRERVQFLGGQVNFQGISNKGTTVTVTIPLE